MREAGLKRVCAFRRNRRQEQEQKQDAAMDIQTRYSRYTRYKGRHYWMK
jgi:hypothetical protein